MIPGSSAQAGRVSLPADRPCAGFLTYGWHTGTPSTPLNPGPVSARSCLRVDNIWILPIDEQRIDLTRHAARGEPGGAAIGGFQDGAQLR